MDLLPYELIHIIYDYISARDAINLASTCKWLYNNMSEEHKRVFNIRKKYIPINNAINNIKYYISDYLSIFYKRSLRIISGDLLLKKDDTDGNSKMFLPSAYTKKCSGSSDSKAKCRMTMYVNTVIYSDDSSFYNTLSHIVYGAYPGSILRTQIISKSRIVEHFGSHAIEICDVLKNNGIEFRTSK